MAKWTDLPVPAQLQCTGSGHQGPVSWTCYFCSWGGLQMIKLYLPWLSLFDQSLCFSLNFWSLTNFSSGSDLCMVSMLFAIGDYNDQGPVLWADHLVIFIAMLASILCWMRNQCVSLFCLFGHLRPQINLRKYFVLPGIKNSPLR